MPIPINISNVSSFLYADRRPKILHELVTTEQRYISSMKVLLDLFLPSLEEIMAPEDLRNLFPWQLDQMIEIHEKLLERLKEGISQWKGIVGDVFGRIWSDKQVRDIADNIITPLLCIHYLNSLFTILHILAAFFGNMLKCGFLHQLLDVLADALVLPSSTDALSKGCNICVT